MKPRTKLQHQVYNLSKTLNPLSENQKLWVYDNCLPKVGFASKKSVSCLECGHTWNAVTSRQSLECPECSIKLSIVKTRKRTLEHPVITIAMCQVVSEFQVIRYFELGSAHKIGKTPNRYLYEVAQQWFTFNGKPTIVARNLSYHNYGWHGALEIKTNYSNYYTRNKYNLFATYIHKDFDCLPQYKMRGFSNKLKGFYPYSFLNDLASCSYTETLLKAKQFSLLVYDNKSLIRRYWDSIKISLRNNYIVKDAGLWIDYIELLSYFRKDLRNSKFVCPKNLKKEHDILVERKTRIISQQRAENERKNLEVAEQRYRQTKSAFFGIVFTDGKIAIKVLESIEAFKKEAEAHKHCVFSNSYYQKEDSLILSATIDDTPLETIELSLSKMRILQSRGFGNEASEYNDQIIKLVNKNLKTIRKVHKQLKAAV